MATKYKRRDDGARRDGFHGRVIDFSARKPISPQKKLLIIYSGIGVITILLFAYHVLSQNLLFAWDPVQTGEGIILEKWTEDLESGAVNWVRVEAEATTGSGMRTFTGKAQLDAESWAALKTGDAVDITFRPSKRGPDMRIESMSRDDADAAP